MEDERPYRGRFVPAATIDGRRAVRLVSDVEQADRWQEWRDMVLAGAGLLDG